MHRIDDKGAAPFSKKSKPHKPLPSELVWELIMFIPIMRLFEGREKAHCCHRCHSLIGAISWNFDVFRIKRKNTYFELRKKLDAIFPKFNHALTAYYHKVQTKEFTNDFPIFAFFGNYNSMLETKSITIRSPVKSFIWVSSLCEQLIDFAVRSPNAFSLRRRISIEGCDPIELPRCLQLSACSMVQKGIQPQVRSDGHEIYRLFNAQLDKSVGYVWIVYDMIGDPDFFMVDIRFIFFG